VRLYDVSEGQILINNQPIQEYTLRSLRQQISLVPQDAFLFSDSVKNNLMFGNFSHPQDHEFEWVSDVVDMQKEIQQMPNQFETQLGEKGVNLSGGQRQRLTIARAIMTNPSLTILDDSLSAVDMTTEEKIKHALRINSEKHVGRSMQIIVAHRLSSLKNMEKILVLNNGEVEAFGSPDLLIKTSLTYKTFAEIQGES
jgi:ATP-binding cassette subfamily B protein